MRSKLLAVLGVALLASVAGCGGVLGGGGGSGGGAGTVTITTETHEGNEFVYVQGSNGLPKGTTITAEITVTTNGSERTFTANDTLDRKVSGGTKVYLGGTSGGSGGTTKLTLVVGERPGKKGALDAGNAGASGKIEVTVDTGSSTTTETFSFGSDGN